MITIYKYPLQVEDNQVIEILADATPLSVGVQDDKPVLWMKVDTENPTTFTLFTTHGTGHSIPNEDKKSYIGTYQLSNGFVGHVFIKEKD